MVTVVGQGVARSFDFVVGVRLVGAGVLCGDLELCAGIVPCVWGVGGVVV